MHNKMTSSFVVFHIISERRALSVLGFIWPRTKGRRSRAVRFQSVFMDLCVIRATIEAQKENVRGSGESPLNFDSSQANQCSLRNDFVFYVRSLCAQPRAFSFWVNLQLSPALGNFDTPIFLF